MIVSTTRKMREPYINIITKARDLLRLLVDEMQCDIIQIVAIRYLSSFSSSTLNTSSHMVFHTSLVGKFLNPNMRLSLLNGWLWFPYVWSTGVLVFASPLLTSWLVYLAVAVMQLKTFCDGYRMAYNLKIELDAFHPYFVGSSHPYAVICSILHPVPLSWTSSWTPHLS